MSDVSDVQRLIRVEDYLTPDVERPGDLLGTLKVKRTPGTTRVTVKSRKWKNCILNWKKFLFDVLPVSVGAATVVPSSAAAAAIIGLQAVKSAIDAMDLELPTEASEMVLRLAQLQRAAEADGSAAWIPVASLIAEPTAHGAEGGGLMVVLRDLERLGVVRFDLTDAQVRTVEEIRFEETS